MHRLLIVLLLASGPMRLLADDLPLAPQFEDGGEHHYVQGAGGAASVSLTAKPVGRLVVGFPAGNSGAGLWLQQEMRPGGWKLAGPPELIARGTDGRHGVSGVVATAQASLTFRAPLAGSLRFLRGYDRESAMDPRASLAGMIEGMARLSPEVRARAVAGGLMPENLARWLLPEVRATPRSIVLAWGALAGGVANTLEVSVAEGGTITREPDGRLRVVPGPAGTFGFRATCAYAPLTPWSAGEIYDPAALSRLTALERTDPKRGLALRQGLGRLRFLVYREKLLAGSWRYLTYFGRDTLLTLRMLMTVFTPAVIEASLDSVLARLSPEGKVAHEEDLGDQAALDRARELLSGRTISPGPLDTPVYDYKMVDSDFILPIALSEYARDARVGTRRARGFLAHGERLARVRVNAESVLSQAAGYAAAPGATRMVALVAGSAVGDWRDSLDGLAQGRFAFSLNAVLIPQALAAIEELLDAGLMGAAAELAPYPTLAGVAKDRGALARMRTAWAGARAHFVVRRNWKEVANLAASYLATGPLEPPEKAFFGSALSAAKAGDLAFPAVSLDAEGQPIPVMCSDDALALFGPALPPEELPERVRPLVLPFPAGLLTPAGLFVASPALSGSVDLWTRFARRHYHGTVVWAWPMAMAELGVSRQLDHLPAGAARDELLRARATLREGRHRLEARGLGELWAFHAEGGVIAPFPFGANPGDTTESNSLQLWSASWLALALDEAR